MRLKEKILHVLFILLERQGNPKGVMLSHGGILHNCEGAQELLNSLIKTKPFFDLATIISFI